MPGAIDYKALLDELGSEIFPRLRPAQARALESYSATHTATGDLAIELPTGAGKSLIALLICEAWRREGATVAVLTGNKTLARQMEREGNSLGVPVERFEGAGSSIGLPRRRRYRRAHAIGIMNYWVMFNQNPVIDSPDLLVIDDAHLAETALDSLYSVEIDRVSHPALFNTLVSALGQAFPDYATFQDALAEVPSRAGAELLSFLDQHAFADRLRSIVDNAAELQTDDDLRFRWARVRERLLEVNIYADTRAIWLRPYVYPLQDNDRYADARQRIYMSATIGDPADLARRLGTRPIVTLPVNPDEADQTYGRRLLVLNPDDPDTIPGRLEAVTLAALRIQPKSLWLCGSKADAEQYRSAATAWLESNGLPAQSWTLTSLGDELDRFKEADAGHLFVAGRFDGMDFSADECRLVVLATLPRAINLQEAFVADYLRDAGFMMQRLNQRILQALGRCNRADDDFGVYLLIDRRFAAHFGQEARRHGLPANVQAEIDLAENQTELADADLVERVERFLRQDFATFDSELDAVAVEVPEQPDARPDSSNDEVLGWLEMHGRQDYRSAEQHFLGRQEWCSAVGLRELAAFAQWSEAKAAYLEGRRGDSAAAERALVALENAIHRGGATSSWFNRLRSSLLRYRAGEVTTATVGPDDFRAATIRAFDELLERIGLRKFERWSTRLETDLRSSNHDQFVAGLAQLGEVLGYATTRPRYGAATDCRWRGVFGNWREVVTWEAKIEQGVDAKVDAHAIGQANNQRNRAETELGPSGYRVRGTVVTHLEQIEPSAAASAGTIKVVRRDAVLALWFRVRALLGLYAESWTADSPEARLLAADRVAPRLPDTCWLDRALTTDELFVVSDLILAEWPD